MCAVLGSSVDSNISQYTNKVPFLNCARFTQSYILSSFIKIIPIMLGKISAGGFVQDFLYRGVVCHTAHHPYLRDCGIEFAGHNPCRTLNIVYRMVDTIERMWNLFAYIKSKYEIEIIKKNGRKLHIRVIHISLFQDIVK